jgi:signal transduction histidine kinase
MTRSIRVDARGEVALLKDKINEMIRNLKETTQKNTEQDWLKTNLARHTQMLQGHRDLATVARLIVSEVPPIVAAQHATFYILDPADGTGEPVLRLAATYAYPSADAPREFRVGEGLVGQCALDGRRILLSSVPEGYVRVRSSLGETAPANVVVLPAMFEGRLKGVLELASLQPFSSTSLDFLDQMMESVGIVLNTIEVNMRTEELLKQSQRLFAEAQEASRSKSAFLSMAAHELRTPLSVVIGYLSMLHDGSLPPDRWQGALRVLVQKARELNSLVNDLLLAARIEGGTVPTEVTVLDLREVTRSAIGRAEARATLVRAEINFEEPTTPVLVKADREQLGRIVDNLINNALTYTTGAPWVRIAVTDGEQPSLTVEDRGIGIALEHRERVFERFFRVDDPSVGPQPGTGLGLYISRELAERHGGSLVLDRSEPGLGSIFILRLPPPTTAEREITIVSGPVVGSVLEPVVSP